MAETTRRMAESLTVTAPWMMNWIFMTNLFKMMEKEEKAVVDSRTRHCFQTKLFSTRFCRPW